MRLRPVDHRSPYRLPNLFLRRLLEWLAHHIDRNRYQLPHLRLCSIYRTAHTGHDSDRVLPHLLLCSLPERISYHSDRDRHKLPDVRMCTKRTSYFATPTDAELPHLFLPGLPKRIAYHVNVDWHELPDMRLRGLSDPCERLRSSPHTRDDCPSGVLSTWSWSLRNPCFYHSI